MVVRELRGRFSFTLLLKIVGISKQIYYYESSFDDPRQGGRKVFSFLYLVSSPSEKDQLSCNAVRKL
jgi:hypothetical protein